MAQTWVPQQLRGVGWSAGPRGGNSRLAVSNWQLAVSKIAPSSFEIRQARPPAKPAVANCELLIANCRNAGRLRCNNDPGRNAI